MRLKAQLRCGQSQHAAQLATANNANTSAWR
jgi:hypothetical protein